MILKQKSQMTGRELCDLEGLIFPIISLLDENKDKKQMAKAQKDAFVDLISKDGQELVKLCYTSDDGLKIEEVAEQYRFRLMQDFPHIMAFVFETTQDEKPGKPTRQNIKKR